MNETKKALEKVCPEQNAWVWRQAAEHHVVSSMSTNCACSRHKWAGVMGILNLRNLFPFVLKNLVLYSTVVIACFTVRTILNTCALQN